MDEVLELLRRKRKTRCVITEEQAEDIARFERQLDDDIVWCLAQGDYPEVKELAAREYRQAVRRSKEPARLRCAWIAWFEWYWSWADIARAFGFRTWKEAKLEVEAFHQRLTDNAPSWWGWWHCLLEDMKRSHRARDLHPKYSPEEVARHKEREHQINKILKSKRAQK